MSDLPANQFIPGVVAFQIGPIFRKGAVWLVIRLGLTKTSHVKNVIR
jgi:hypothetical protein